MHADITNYVYKTTDNIQQVTKIVRLNNCDFDSWPNTRTTCTASGSADNADLVLQLFKTSCVNNQCKCIFKCIEPFTYRRPKSIKYFLNPIMFLVVGKWIANTISRK